MTWLEALLLAVVQGLTEFLPVSSSGHLAVADQWLSGHADLFFAVMLHVGTLGAILAYSRGAAASATRGLLGLDGGPRRASLIRCGLLAIAATVPIGVVGLTIKDRVEAAFDSPIVPAIGFLVTASVLLATTRLREGSKGPSEMTWRDALLIGLAQAAAITPGVSRSGSTIAAALAVGCSRSWAVGFSLLLAVPAILGAAVVESLDIDPTALAGRRVAMTAVATVVSGLVGYGAIVWLVRVVRSGRLWYFSAYLVVLAIVTIGMAMSGRGPATTDRPDSAPVRVEITDGPPAGRG